MTADAWLALDRRGLARALAAGHPVSPEDLAGHRYVGLSLGLPGWVDRLAWKVFEKAFHREPATGRVRGWNVRLAQRSWAEAPEPLTRGGAPRTFGHFTAVSDPGERRPAPVPGAVLLDYGAGGNPWFDPVRRLRDPVVAVHAGSADLLLGWSWLDLGVGTLGTPSYFLLRRHGTLEHAPPDPLKSAPARSEFPAHEGR